MSGTDRSILVVDDEPANVLLLQKLLSSSGYQQVECTTDPHEVLRLYKEIRPDLILLDLHMPGLNGFEVMDHLAAVISPHDYVPILVLTADASPDSRQKALTSGAKDFLTKPFDADEVLVRVANLLEARSLHLQLRGHNELLEEKVKERTSALWSVIGQLERAQTDLRVAQEETITALSLAAEFRDDETSRHIERMSRYCGVLANAADLDVERTDIIRLAAKMHDVGKIGVPDSILLKPGKLTYEEFDIMKTHAQIGYEILGGSTSALAKTAATIAWTHHEKVDGTGYPNGLSGSDIPFEGRIAAVADVFDALTTNRVYRKAFDLPQSLDIMREGRGTHFDADLLDLFFERMDEVLTLKQELDEASLR
jgi:putative two-component system response regulator